MKFTTLITIFLMLNLNSVSAQNNNKSLCDLPHNGNLEMCRATNPSYCELSHNGNLLACIGSKPDYCDHPQNGELGACKRVD